MKAQSNLQKDPYSEDYIRKARLMVKIFTAVPDERGQQMLTAIDAFADGLKAGMQLADQQHEKNVQTV